MMRLLFLLFLLWRGMVFFSAWIGEKILPFAPRFPYADVYLTSSGLPRWVWSFANFDGVHYLGIAQNGYWAQYTQVFFPLYPLAIRFLHSVFPFISNILSGLVASNVFFFVSLIIFYKLIMFDFESKTAIWAILFLLAFPVSFFFGSIYTEGLFFFLVITSFYFSRKQKWWLAAVFGGLSSATKLIGIFMLPALLYEYWIQQKKLGKAIKDNLRFAGFLTTFGMTINTLLKSPTLYIVPLGLISYMLYLQVSFGDALYFWHAQPIFGAERTGNSIIVLPQVLYRYIKILLSNSMYQESFWIPLLELGTTLLAIGSLIWAQKIKIRASYLIFSWCAVVIPTLTGTLSSMPRYVLVAFPMYMVFAQLHSVRLKRLLLTIFLVLSCILTILFTAGHWVA